MSENDETLQGTPSSTGTPDQPIITAQGDSQENKDLSSDPSNKDPKPGDLVEGAKNFQHAIQLTREREKAEKDRADKLEAELAEIRKQEKEKAREGLSEADRYKAIAEEKAEENAKLRLNGLVNSLVTTHKIPKALAGILERPWNIPEIEQRLPENPTWEQVVDVTNQYLPAYVESLSNSLVESQTGNQSATSNGNQSVGDMGDPERPVNNTPTSNHIYTRQEVAEISRDPILWEKHGPAIKAQMARNGGRI